MARGKSRSASALALMTKSLNEGAGWSPAAALSCLRSATASSMSTSTVRTKSGAVAFDSAIRRATVFCSRVRSCSVVSPRPACLSPEMTGAGTSCFGASSCSAAGAGASSSFGGASCCGGASASAVAAPPLAAASTSAFTIRPPGPGALQLAELDAHLARHPLGDGRGLDAVAAAVAGGRLGLRGRRLGRLLALAVAGGVLFGLLLRLRLLGLGLLGRRLLVSGSSAGASDPSPSRAIVSPTGSVSPSFATIVSVPSESAS